MHFDKDGAKSKHRESSNKLIHARGIELDS